MTRLTIQDIEDLEVSFHAFTESDLKEVWMPKLISELKRLKTELNRLAHIAREAAE